MKLDELRTVQSKERRKDSLQQLRDSFYQDVAAYIQDLKASRDRRATQVDDPFSDDEVRRMSDELETAEEVAEAVYERRVGKVVKLASFAAADMPVDDDGMTGEERELFDDLVDRIERNKHTVLDVLSGSGESTTSAEPTPTESTTSAEPTPTESTTSAEPTPTESVDTGDSGPIPTDPADSGPIPTDPANSQPAPPSPPTEAVDPDGTEPSTDNVLAEAMGASGTTAQRSGGEDSSTNATSGEVPPPEAEREPDIVETPTDGGTAAEATESAPTETPSATERPSTSKTPAADEAAATGKTAETADADAPTTASAGNETPDDSDRTTLRITRDVGEIFGVDGREYTLRSEDIVTLPTTNAEPLVEQDAAMRVE